MHVKVNEIECLSISCLKPWQLKTLLPPWSPIWPHVGGVYFQAFAKGRKVVM